MEVTPESNSEKVVESNNSKSQEFILIWPLLPVSSA